MPGDEGGRAEGVSALESDFSSCLRAHGLAWMNERLRASSRCGEAAAAGAWAADNAAAAEVEEEGGGMAEEEGGGAGWGASRVMREE